MAKFYTKEEEFKEVLKSGETPEKLVYKEFVPEEQRAVNDTALTIDFTISSSNIDRMHDSIDQNGWELKAFKKNPVVLWAHDQSQPPVAKALPRSLKVDGKKLVATAQFMPADVSEFSYMIFQMYKLGFMNATSVGFRPLEWSFAEDEKRPYGVNFTKQELLEFSCVPVPANADALMGAKSMGVNTRPLKSWVEQALDNWKENGDLLVPRSNLETLHKSLSARTKLLKPLEDVMTEKTDETEVEVKEQEVVQPQVVETETKETVEVENKTMSADEMHQCIREAHGLYKAAASMMREAASIHRKAQAKMKAIVDPDGTGDDYQEDEKSLDEIVVKSEVEVKVDEVSELIKTVKALQEQVKELTETVSKANEVTVEQVAETEVAEVETKSDEITISFEDSVDTNEDSVNVEELKSLLNSIDFEGLIEKKLKTKLGSKD